MSDLFSPEEVAIVIRGRQLLKNKRIAADTDIAGVCKAAGISRKTGYQWAEKHFDNQKGRCEELEAKLKKLQSDKDRLKKDVDRLGFENRGRKLAWEIHRVDELLAGKKTPPAARKRKSGDFFQK